MHGAHPRSQLSEHRQNTLNRMLDFRCHHCGYDLNSLVDYRPTPPAAVCPECGKRSAFGRPCGTFPARWLFGTAAIIAAILTVCFAIWSVPNRGDWGFPSAAYLLVPPAGLLNGGVIFFLWIASGRNYRNRQKAMDLPASSLGGLAGKAITVAILTTAVTIFCTGWAVGWATNRP